MRENKRNGINISQVARDQGVNWRTAKKYMSSSCPPKYSPRQRAPTNLDPHKDYIKGRLEIWPLTAVKIFEEIQERGYTGGYTAVKEFVRPFKRDKAIAAELRYETKPGQQGQADWFRFGSVIVDTIKRPLWCFSAILGYSRTRFVTYTTDATTPTFIQCHLEAFNYFGGFPEVMLYDNTGNVVLKRLLKSSDSIWNPLFKDFFMTLEFTPRLCKPGKEGAKTKGKIEKTGRYIRDNFFMGLEFDSLSDLNAKALAWCHKVNSKPNGTTNEIPFERLKSETLQPMTGRPIYIIVITEIRKISNDSYLSYRGNKYSVPWRNAGREAKLLIKGSKMEVQIGGELVCIHEIIPGSKRRIRVKEHFVGLLKEIYHRNRANHIRRIDGVGTAGPVTQLMNGSEIEPRVQERDLSVYDVHAEKGADQ